MIIRVLIENTARDPELIAEHGLSLYIEAAGKRILFDAGRGEAFSENAKKLGVGLASVDLCVLSHGHYDHSGGLLRFLETNDHAPVYVNERAFEPHHSADGRDIGVDPLLADSSRIVRTGDHFEICEGLTLVTCNDRISGVPASARGMTVMKDGAFVQDDFAHEQYLIITEGDKRVVISGCSHKGILNIVRWLSPDVLIGGFHFMKLNPEGEDAALLDDAALALLAAPCVYYTGHCTGEAPYTYLKERMGERLHAIYSGKDIEL